MLLAVVSCDNKEADKKNNQKDTTDTLGDKAIYEDNVLVSVFTEYNKLPYNADSAFITKVSEDEKFQSLSSAEVEMLFKSYKEMNITMGAEYDISNFFKIDSLKTSGKYEEYVESLDIGMMKESVARAAHRIKIDENTELLTWYLTYSTYEACPYASGTMMFATIMYYGQFGEGIVLADQMGAGDPPSTMSRSLVGKINQNGKIELNLVQENGDEDENGPITEITKKSCVFQLNEGVLDVVSEKKQ